MFDGVADALVAAPLATQTLLLLKVGFMLVSSSRGWAGLWIGTAGWLLGGGAVSVEGGQRVADPEG